MSNLEHCNKLINELTSFDVTEQRMLEIRNELLQIIFDFKDASVFDELVEWNYHVKTRIEDNKINLNRPGNSQGVNQLAVLTRQLFLRNN